MEGLLQTAVILQLKEHFKVPYILHKTLVLYGKGESEVAEHIADFETALPLGIKLAYLPNYGLLKLRLTGHGTAKAALEKKLQDQFAQLKENVEEWLIADEDKGLPEVLGELLKEKKKLVATAESCMGAYR